MTQELYWSLLLALRLLMLGLLVVILSRIRQQRKDVNLIKELQSKLSTLEDTQPCLVATVFPYPCELTYQQQPSADSRRTKMFHGGKGFFMLLRVTNEPKSTSNRAIAKNLHAIVQYYDEHGKELPLFPSTEGAWVTLDQQTGSIKSVEHFSHYTLHPQDFKYLAIALRYPWGKSPDRYALNVLNLRQPDWVDTSLLLPTKTTIKVTLSCHRFKSEQFYTLTDLGPEKGLHLVSRETISSIPSQPVSTP